MRNTILILSLTIFVVFFQGCSSKKYFEPEDTSSISIDVYDIESTIVDFHASGATLENNSFISKKGVSTLTLEEGYKFLSQNDQIVLSTNDNGVLMVDYGDSKIKKIEFEKNVISAAIDGNLIAYLLIDNSIGLYDLDQDRFVLKEYLTVSVLNDTRIATPIFLNSLILYPTLDGKVIIVDKAQKAIYKTINLDPQGDVNNIIYLEALGNTLIAATNNKLFTFLDGRVKTVTHEIRDIAVSNENIFVATLDGTIIKYDQSLTELASVKFKFAKIFALSFGTELYALESQDYLIKMDKDLSNYTVYDFSFDEDEKVFSLDNKIYFENSYLIFE
jgi:hypothetical protein